MSSMIYKPFPIILLILLNPMINEGDESLMNPDYLKVAVRRRVVGGMLAVMNSSVADTKQYNSLYEATDDVNGVTYVI